MGTSESDGDGLVGGSPASPDCIERSEHRRAEHDCHRQANPWIGEVTLPVGGVVWREEPDLEEQRSSDCQLDGDYRLVETERVGHSCACSTCDAHERILPEERWRGEQRHRARRSTRSRPQMSSRPFVRHSPAGPSGPRPAVSSDGLHGGSRASRRVGANGPARTTGRGQRNPRRCRATVVVRHRVPPVAQHFAGRAP
jgi:hypothetical protein